MFNSGPAIEIIRKLQLAKKLEEQQEEIRLREIQEAEDRLKINEWWAEEQKKIKPWSKEYRAFMQKHTFTP